MIELVKHLLDQHGQVDDYEITVCNTKSSQLFYVLDRLETNRITNNRDISVTVYCDFDEYRGSSNFMVNSADDEKSVSAKIVNAVSAAHKIKNPKFELVKPSTDSLVEVGSIDNENLTAVTLKVADAIMAANVYKEGWINSTEIFVEHVEHRFINSQGVDLHYGKTTLETEIIPTWKGQEEEIELYLDFKLCEENYDEITKRTDKILNEARARGIATKPSEEMKSAQVVMSGEMLALLMNNFAEDIHFANVYTESNHYKENDKLVDYDFNLTMKANVADSVSSAPNDGNGLILKDTKIIENGQVKQYWGANRFGQYLGKTPTGNLPIVEVNVEPGVQTELPLPCIEILNFSSPQLESSSGYFGGEVRLGIYHDTNGEKTPITGFSVSGNIYEALKNATYSKASKTYENYHGPEFIAFKDCDVQ